MVEYTTRTRPGEQCHPADYAADYTRKTTVIRSGNSNGVIAAVVLFIMLLIAGFVVYTADEARMNNTANPAAETNMQVAPETGAEQARPVPAPDAPAEIAPAAPADAVPAPAGN